MAKTPRQHEQSDRGEASAGKPMTRAEAAKAMERFKSLTRDLLKIPREKIEAEEQRYRKSRSLRRDRKV